MHLRLGPGQVGTFVTTSKNDYSEMRKAIAKLSRLKVQYDTPDPSKMAEAFAEALDLNKDALMQEVEALDLNKEAPMQEGHLSTRHGSV